ncbi:MAG: 50S ribosomal protein L25 [Myxococcota bacterium]
MVQVSDTIECVSRTSGGKGEAHKLRKAGKVPGVVYGPGSPVRNVAVDPRTFRLQREQYGLSHIYDVVVDGKERFKALIKALQRDVVNRTVDHVDLYAVDMNKPIRVSVRIELVGKPAGAIEGGVLSQLLRRVEVQCLPGDVPAAITLDISPMALGDILHLSDLPLPPAVKLTSHQNEAVARVAAPQEEVAPVAAAEAVEGAEGAEAPEGAEGAKPGAEKADKADKADKKV